MGSTGSARRRKRFLIALAASLAVLSISAGATSLALFTSSATFATVTFSTGTVVISTTPANALITFATMAPGDVVTAPLTVSNTGSLNLRYAISSVATDPDGKSLKDRLVLTIKNNVTTCTNAGFGATGVVRYSGDLDSTAGQLVGDNATGAQAGDRNLAAGASEVLCFRAALPLVTGNAFQDATTTATFTFDAEQTDHN